ncbi:MAG: hypothetical protein IJ418_14130 [Clostridia bacterium]|nr:hypothetical protein [Clostridia bacterium]
MFVFFYLLVIVILILHPSDTAQSALEAMRIWGGSIVPVLFPYMVFSRLLCKSLQTLALPAEPAVAALGLLGGSPSGAAMITAYADRLSPKSLYPLCALCGTVSPMFILGTMQAWTNNESLCRRLLLCHWLCALLCAGIIRLGKRHISNRTNVPQTFESSVNPIVQSIDAILQVGGCVICYSVLSSILAKLLRSLSLLQPLVHAMLEISGGVHAIWQSNLPFMLKCIALSAALGFGGLSILTQNQALLKHAGVSMRSLIGFALIRCVLSAALMALSQYLFPIN